MTKINNIHFTEREINHVIASLSYCIRFVIPNAPTVKDMRTAMKKLRCMKKSYRLSKYRKDEKSEEVKHED